MKPTKELKDIQKKLKNVKAAKEGTPLCEQVMGSQAAVASMANIWKNNASELHLIASAALLDYCTNKNFTPQELQAFKLGLSSIPDVLSDCYAEIEGAKKAIELKQV